MIRLRRFAVPLLALSLALLGVLAGAVLVLRSENFLRRIKPWAEARLAAQAGFPVSIARIEGTAFGRLIVHGLVVHSRARGRPLVRVREARVRFLPRALLHRELQVSSVELAGMEIHTERDADRPFDVETLVANLTRPGQPGRPGLFIRAGSVTASDARIEVVDHPSRLRLRVEDVHLESSPARLLALSNRRRVAVRTGPWNLQIGDGRARADAAEGDVRITAVGLHVERLTWRTGDSHLTARGSLRLAERPSLSLTVNASVRIADVRSLNPASLREASGKVRTQGLWVYGSLSGPRIGGHWRAEELSVGGTALPALAGAIHGDFGAVRLTNVRGNWLGGSVVADVQVPLDGQGHIEVAGKASGLTAAAVGRQFLPDVRELRDADARISGEFTATARPDGLASDGRWTAAGATWRGRAVMAGRPMHGRHELRGDRFVLSAEAGGVRLRAEGRTPRGGQPLDIAVEASADDIAPIAALVETEATGALTLAARAHGSADGPTASFDAGLRNAALLGYPVPQAHIAGTWQGNELRLDAATLAADGGGLRGSGSVVVANGQRPELDISVEADNFPLDAYLAGLAGSALKGAARLSGALRLYGPLAALEGGGRLDVRDASVQGVPLAFAPFDVVAQGGRFHIPGVRVRIGEAESLGSFSLDARGYEFTWRLTEPTALARLADMVPSSARPALDEMSGSVRAEAQGSAPYAAPTATLTVSVADASLRGVHLGESVLEVLLDGPRVRARGALVDGGFRVEASGAVQRDSLPFAATVYLEDADVLPLVRLIGTPPGLGLGHAELLGAISVAGDALRPETIAADVALDSVRLRTPLYTLQSARRLHGRLTASGLELDSAAFHSTDPEHPFEVLIAGLLDRERPFEFDVDARVFDLPMVAHFLGVPVEWTGTGTYRLRVEGTGRAPVLDMEWQVPEATVRLRPDAPPLRLSDVFGRLTYRERQVTVERLDGRIAGNAFALSGVVPLDLSFLLVPLVRGIPDAPVRLRLRSEHGDVSWLRSVFPSLEALSGRASLDFQATGPAARPIVAGTVRLEATRVDVAGLAAPFEDMRADVQVHTERGAERDRMAASVSAAARLGSGVLTVVADAVHPLPREVREARFDPGAVTAAVRGRLGSVRLADWLRAFGLPALPLDGVLTGTFEGRGRGVQPTDWEGTATLTEAVVLGGGRALENREAVVVAFDGGQIDVRQCELGDGRQRLAVSGQASANGRLSVEVRADALDVGLFSGFFPPDMALEGRLDGGARLTGTAADPRFAADWQVAGGRIAHVLLDSFTGAVAYDGDALRASDWRLRSYGNTLAIAGEMPLDIRLASPGPLVRPRALPMRVSLDTAGFDLSFLSLVAPAVREASGVAEMHVAVEGTTSRPVLTGSVAVRAGRLVLAHNGMALDDVAVAVRAEGDAIQAPTLSFRVGSSEYRAGAVRVLMDGLRPRALDATLHMENAALESWAAAPGESPITSSVTGHVSIHVALAEVLAAAATNRLRLNPSPAGPLETVLAASRYAVGAAVLQSARVDVGRYALLNSVPVLVAVERGHIEVGTPRNGPFASGSGAPHPAVVAGDGRIALNSVLATDLAPLEFSHPPGAPPGREATLHARAVWDVGESLQARAGGTLGAAVLDDWLRARLPQTDGTAPAGVRGSFAFDVEVTGTESVPRIGIAGRAANLSVGMVPIANVSVRAAVEGGAMRLEAAEVVLSGSRVLVSGDIPLEFSLLAASVGIPARDFQVRVDAEIENLDFVPLIWPVVERARGRGSLRATIGGRWESPKYRGTAQFDRVFLDMPSARLIVDSARGRLVLAEDALRVESASGTINDGSFVLTGDVSLSKGLPEAVRLAATLRGPTFYEPDVYRATLDANLRAVGRLDNVQLSGDVTFASLRYEEDWQDFVDQNFRSKTQLRQKARFNYPILQGLEVDVQVQGSRNIELRTALAQVDVGVDGEVVGPISELVFRGEASIQKGEFSYLRRRFTIDSGRVLNTDVGVFNPEYTITASTAEPLRGVLLPDVQGTPQRRDARVRMTLTGTLEKPLPPTFEVVVLNRAVGEEYALEPTQVVALLTFGDAGVDTGGGSLSSAAGGLLVEGAEFYLGGVLAQTLGLRSLDVEVDPAQLEGTRVLFTKELSSKWALTYGSRLQLQQDQRIELEYRMTPHLSVVGERNEEGKVGVDLRVEYDFR
jgi:autotransporter translocation and assembly factor TamB